MDLIPPKQQLKVQNGYFLKKIKLNSTIIELIRKNCKSGRVLVQQKAISRSKIDKFRLKGTPSNASINSGLESEERLLYNIVSEMATEFKQPEEEIIKENDESTKFFFVIQGDCLLNIRDENYYLH